jgi:ethanolamine utilization protein EutA
MAESRPLLSVGLDVGTTTTQVVFSRLTVADQARPGQVPRIGITAKEILYQSPIFFTPLKDRETVDAARLTELVRREYASAGVDPGRVETGAVIITGEAAKKKNADEILQSLAGLAGDFVVTVAGPHLESLIAGRGSGAAAYSQSHYTTVINVDIGGGSANSAIFKQGQLVAAAAMNYGGRILEIEHTTGRVRHVAEPARHILADLHLRLEIGDSPSFGDLRRFTDRMADLTVELIEGTASPLAARLYLTPPSPVSGRGTTLMLSGGIGQYYFEPVPAGTVAEVIIHDDLGPLLSDSLRRHAGLQAYQIVRPAETMRATVLGASSQTVTLSGSTIWADRQVLPLRNLPVIRPTLSLTPNPPSGRPAGRGVSALSPLPVGEGWPSARVRESHPTKVASAIADAVRRWDVNPQTDPFAIALEIDQSLDYNQLLQLAGGLSEFAAALPPERPLVAIVARDYAQALGQTVKSMAPGRPLLIIDQVGLEEGDYIDIGMPLMDGRVVPVSVKTLVFYH